MIKFATKYQKQLKLACRKEASIYIYRYMLGTAGPIVQLNAPMAKYLLYVYKYFKSNGSLSRVRGFCMFTGRTRGFYRTFRMSRMKIREAIKEGSFLGIRKTSW